MNGTSAKAIVSQNLKTLKEASLSLKGPMSIEKAGGPGHSSVHRVEKGEQAPTVEVVEQLAKVFGLKPWQFLIPGITATADGTNHPPVAGLPGWPFDRVPQARYEALAHDEQIFLQGVVLATIQNIENERPRKKLGRVK